MGLLLNCSFCFLESPSHSQIGTLHNLPLLATGSTSKYKDLSTGIAGDFALTRMFQHVDGYSYSPKYNIMSKPQIKYLQATKVAYRLDPTSEAVGLRLVFWSITQNGNNTLVSFNNESLAILEGVKANTLIDSAFTAFTVI